MRPDPHKDEHFKHWSHSKTIWFNVAIGMTSAGTELMAIIEFLSEDYQSGVRAFLIMLTAIGNVILRLITTEPIR